MKRACAVAATLAFAAGGCAHAASSAASTSSQATPHVLDAEEAVRVAETARGQLCEGPTSAVPSRAWPFPEGGAWLVHLVCFEAAYQPSARLVRVGAHGELAPLALPIVAEEGVLAGTEAVGRVEVEGSLLTEVLLERGLGDCGRRVRARLVGSDRLVFVEHRAQRCDEGEGHTDRDQWPLRSVVASAAP